MAYTNETTDTAIGRYWKVSDDTIKLTPDGTLTDQGNTYDYGDLHEAACRIFVDEYGFSTSDFKVTDATTNGDMTIVASVQFLTGEAVVMAKLHSLLD